MTKISPYPDQFGDFPAANMTKIRIAGLELRSHLQVLNSFSGTPNFSSVTRPTQVTNPKIISLRNYIQNHIIHIFD